MSVFPWTKFRKAQGGIKIHSLLDHKGCIPGFIVITPAKKHYYYITNNFKLAASTIARIYKDRWQVELFYKWIKQNLKIKSFLGTSKNAVMSQIWIAMIYYLLLAYIKYQTKYSYSLLILTRIIRETIFIRVNLIDLLTIDENNLDKIRDGPQQELPFAC